MKNITNFIEEAYNPMADRDQRKVVDKMYKDIAKVIKSKTMKKEDVIAMLEDLLNTYKKEYKL